MNWVDIVIIAVVLVSTFLGFKIGLLRAAFLFIAFVLGTVIGFQVAAWPPSFISNLFSDPNICYFVVLTVVFGLIFIGVNVIGGIIYKALSHTPLKWIDSWFGIFLGFLLGVLLVGSVVMYLSIFPVSDSKEWLDGSFLARTLRSLFGVIFRRFAGEIFSRVSRI